MCVGLCFKLSKAKGFRSLWVIAVISPHRPRATESARDQCGSSRHFFGSMTCRSYGLGCVLTSKLQKTEYENARFDPPRNVLLSNYICRGCFQLARHAYSDVTFTPVSKSWPWRGVFAVRQRRRIPQASRHRAEAPALGLKV